MMKSFRSMALAGLMTFGAFGAMTVTSCNSDKCKDVVCQNGGNCNDGNCSCTYEYEGTTCQTEVRARLSGTYKGSGSDNSGDSYSNFSFIYRSTGTSAKSMEVQIKDDSGDDVVTLPITLTTANTYTINSTTIGTFTYTGSGAFNTNTASIVINQAGSIPLIITFSTLVKQ